ncbi:Proton-translocating ferredoxin:NAD(+) oxidoreductase complex subunit D [Georgfuchsia toluolica]|uniref:Ion-translocating oxidoreductase complex subunit D n=1 Tax=Georgfuchsia toluolica TaxID=424218 RepID=A0A916J421_9PROT|nr:RnfABCDGE type electron transport complex subunit D [Georgfuchsia toluolica]CAG4883576.1 Proton-translocating ferredoxin:NAD(+) oxidoreductase complex subunit D [Georgfuchsia toluolica]
MSETPVSESSPTLHLSSGPHIFSGRSTAQIMWTVNLSLLPALLWAWAVFGWAVLAITLSAILGCVVAEYAVCRIAKTASTIADGSAVCSGLLLAFTLPPGISIWMPFIGGMLALIFTKGIFGGLGYNIFNVALVGRAMMMATFPVEMTTRWLKPALGNVDAVSSATLLAQIKLGGSEALTKILAAIPDGGKLWLDFFLGMRAGSIGEVSVLMIILGAAFLLWKGIIKLYIPLSILAGVALMAPFSPAPGLYMLSGGLWLGAFFMATDYVTSPTMPRGQIIFGLGIGLLTGIIRNWGGYPEGICYAIMLMNILTPALNDWFRPKRLAAEGAPS